MTAAATVEYRIAAALFASPPVAGQYYRRESSAGTVLQVSRVVRVIGGTRATEQYRLIGLRLRQSALPPGIEILPWPRERRVPSRAAEPPCPSERPAIVTRTAKATAERKRITAHRRAQQAAENQVVEPVRQENRSVQPAEWRDPADTNVLRRTPKNVSGFRAVDCLDTLRASGTLTKAGVGAAKRLRRDFEIGALQQNGASDWEKVSRASFGVAPVGVAERVLQFLERYQAATRAMGRLAEIVVSVCLQGETISDYAVRTKINRMSASGRLFAAIQVLQDHYDGLDLERKERDVATINTGQWNEPTAPPAATRWAAD